MKFRRLVVMVLVGLMAFAVAACASSEEKKIEFFEKGKAFFESGDYKNAEIELKNALQIDPRFAEAHRILGETYLKLGQTREAFQQFGQLEQLAPENLEAKRKLATFFFLGKRYEEAAERVDAVLAEKPDDIEMLYLKSGLLQQEGDPAGAAEVFEKIVQLDPAQTRAYMALAQLHSRNEDPTEAEAHLRRAIDVDPAAIQPQLALFSYFISQKEFDRAEAHLGQLLEENPKDVDLRILEGNYYFSRQKEDRAETAYLGAVEVAPEDVRPYLVAAGFYENVNRAKDAQAMYEKALEIQPDEVRTLQPAARFFFEQQAVDRAEGLVDRILEKNPKDFDARMLKGEILVLKREFEPALAVFAPLVEEEPEAERAHYFMGVAYLGDGNPGRAQTSLRKAVDLDPDYDRAKLLLAEIHLRQRNFREARRLSEEVLQEMPGSYQARLVYGNSLMFAGENALARDQFEELVKLDPENPVGHYRLGFLYRLEEDWERAMSHFDRALEINPRLMDVFTNVVLVHSAREEYDAALRKAENQLSVVSESPASQAMVYNLIGGLYIAKGDNAAAEKAFQTALEKNPESLRPYYALARIYLNENRADEAIAQYQAIIEKDPEQAGPHMLLGTLFDMRKDFEQSEAHYRKALEVRPDFAPAANNLAYLLVEQDGSLDEALNLARKARELMPEDPSVMDTLGWVYYHRGLYASAISEFSDSLKKLPDNPVVHYHLGLAYHKDEQPERARAALEKALSLNESFAGADHAREILAGM